MIGVRRARGGHLEHRGACASSIVVYSADLELADLFRSIQQHPSQGPARRVADVHPVHRPGVYVDVWGSLNKLSEMLGGLSMSQSQKKISYDVKLPICGDLLCFEAFSRGAKKKPT